MDGRERAIILGLYLSGVLAYLVVITLRFLEAGLDFDSFKGEYLGALALLTALLIKLPPTKSEAEAQANNAETVEVTGEEVNVSETR